MDAASPTHDRSSAECELLVERLLEIPVDGVGSRGWFAQHRDMEALNMQAHANVKLGRDEYVTEALLTFQKMHILVYDLLVHEQWRRRVYPLVVPRMTADTSIKAYTLLYHESTTIALLEMAMFQKAATLGVGDALLDLADYCARAITYLNGLDVAGAFLDKHDGGGGEGNGAKRVVELLESDEQAQLAAMVDPLEFGIAIHALSVLRFITDYVNEVPLAVLHRLLNTNDMVVQLVYLLEKAPWRILKKNGEIMRFEDGQWRTLTSKDEDRMLGKVEAQIWIALYNLLVDPECRKKYEYTTHRQQTLLRLRPYFLSGDGTLSTHLLDQLPMLADLYRAVEEVGLMQCPVEAESVRSGVMVEAVADVYERVVKSVENTGGSSDAWKVLAERQWRKVFEGTDRREFMMSLSDLYHMDTLEQLLPDDPKCSHCGLTAVQRCSRCKNEWYCGRACQVAGWKVHRPICDLLSTVANGRPEDGGADDAIAKEKCSAAVKSSSVGAGTKILGTSGPVTPGIVEL